MSTFASDRLALEWVGTDDVLAAIEPTPEEVRTHARALAEAYSEPHNRAMMGHDEMSATDVLEYFADAAQRGTRAFLFFRDRALVGDGDLRGIERGAAEIAIMIGARRMQGTGLGTRFALALHAVAFRALGLDRLFAGIRPANAASLRLFAKLGYRVDRGAEARARAEDDDDVVMSTDRAAFEAAHREALDRISIAHRER